MSFLTGIFKTKDSRQAHSISVQQGVAANALSIQALINVLVEKKVCSREELLDELKKISNQNQQHVQLKK